MSIVVRDAGNGRNICILLQDSGATGNNTRVFINPATGAVVSGPTAAGNATAGTVTVTTLANSCYRVDLTCQPNTSGTNTNGTIFLANGSTLSYAGDGTSGVFIGNVQVNTGQPVGMIEVGAARAGMVSWNPSVLDFTSQAAGVTSNLKLDIGSDGEIKVNTGEYVAIDSSGNLGIATAIDHNGRLSIKSTGTEQHLVLEQANVTTDGWGIYGANGGNFEISRMTGTTTFTPRVTINSSGLRVHAGMIIYSTQIEQDNAAGLTFNSSHGSGGIYFSIAGSERMRLDSSGNLHIGANATYPGKLTIVGINGEVVAGNTTDSLATFSDNGAASISIHSGSANTGTIYFGTTGASGNTKGRLQYNHSSDAMIVYTDNTERMRLDSSGNLLLGGSSSPASATRSFAIFNGTAPTGSVTNGVILYAEDVSTSSELKVRDEAGNITTLSPHNFSQIPEGPSEDMAFSYYSEKDNKYINVDMLAVVRELEKLSGKQFVYTGSKKRTRKTKRRMK